LIVLIAFYGFFLLILVAVAAGIFRGLRKRGWGQALIASGLATAFLGLFFPIPVHGSFTFPFEIMLRDLRSERRRVEHQETTDKREAFRLKLAARFTGPLTMTVGEPITEQFSSIASAGGTQGFYDVRSRLAWTPMLPIETAGAPPDLEHAKAFCAQIQPQGYWALPTEAELSLFWKAGGYLLSPLAAYGTAGLLESIDFQTEILSVRISQDGSYALRCVALGPGAPPPGYLSGDIPLDDWNAYQLQKVAPGFGGRANP
jgi:hypothetical protein